MLLSAPTIRKSTHQRARPTACRAIAKAGDKESNAISIDQVADELMPPALQRSLRKEEVRDMRNSIVAKVSGAAVILAFNVTEMRQCEP